MQFFTRAISETHKINTQNITGQKKIYKNQWKYLMWNSIIRINIKRTKKVYSGFSRPFEFLCFEHFQMRNLRWHFLFHEVDLHRRIFPSEIHHQNNNYFRINKCSLDLVFGDEKRVTKIDYSKLVKWILQICHNLFCNLQFTLKFKK